MDAMLVFPHQLFVKERENTVFFYIEDDLFFDRLPFHKHKLILHRASMLYSFDHLKSNKKYFSYPVCQKDLINELSKYEKILAYDFADTSLEEKYQSLEITFLESPSFLTSKDTITAFFTTKTSYFMHDFYVFQRKRLNILMDEGKPLGGKYSFDALNRKKLPQNMNIVKPLVFSDSSYLQEAKKWVKKHFPHNIGDGEDFNYPIHKEDALKQMKYFFKMKFEYFGLYQDALSNQDPYLFHSNLSASLNMGLLTPDEVVNEALKYDVPLNSKEGFIRQIIGWREFVRAVYVLEGKTMKTKNVLNHQRLLSTVWFKGQTGINVIDETIHKLKRWAYSHHIERLMVLGNSMFLLGIHPNEVYRFFMIMHIDAYDWVMVPNIYGMSQYGAGSLMTTKPYFSGANYLKKMGVKKGEWEKSWDALFYLFLEENLMLIKSNPRLSILSKLLEKKDAKALSEYRQVKLTLLNRLTKESKR